MIKLFGLFILTAFPIILPACQTPGTSELSLPAGVDVIINEDDDVLENPSAYVGRQVFVRGRVEELLTDNTFLLDYDGRFGLSKILVFDPQQFKETRLVKNNTVEVTGEVILFNLEELERRIGRDLDDKLFQQYQNQPVIMSSSLLAH